MLITVAYFYLQALPDSKVCRRVNIEKELAIDKAIFPWLNQTPLILI